VIESRLPATYYQLVMMMAMLMMASMMVVFFVSGGIVRAHHRRRRCDSQHHRHKASHHKDKYSAARAFHYTSLLSSSRLLRTRIYVENTYLDCLGCQDLGHSLYLNLRFDSPYTHFNPTP
jgi:hypothetical protein